MQPTFCFIDDADFELDNFAANVAPAFKGVEFVYARDFERAQRKLDDKRCLCFLLDIYGAEPGAEPGEAPPPEELAPGLGQGFDPQSLYQDLEGDGWERANQFLRRLFERVRAAQDAFDLAAGQIGQSRAYGLGNLALVKEHYPWATAMGYSRKATYADAAAICMAGAHGALSKPQGEDEKAIAKASQEAGPKLARAVFAAVDQRLAGLVGGLGLRLCQEGAGLPLVEALELSLEQINGVGTKRSRSGRAEALERLKAVRHEDIGLSAVDKEIILCLWDWLSLEI